MLQSRIHAGFVILATLAAGAASCGRKPARASVPAAPARVGTTQTGVASWYGVPYHGRRTSSGEIYDMNQMTAAHRDLPFQTWVAVTNLGNGKTVDVRITDRGPFVHGRIIDLSQAAARDIDMLRAGTARVRLVVIPPPQMSAARSAPPPLPSSPPAPAVPRVAAKPAPETPAPPLWFVVQAGAFADRERAEALRAQMVEAFAEARVILGDGDRPLWKVLVGRQMTSDQAADLASRVRRESGTALVVPEPDRSE